MKAKQIRISTTILGFFYFLSILLTNQFTQIVSRNKQQTQYFLEIIRLFHETNSDPNKPRIDSTYDSKTGFRFLPNRSVIQVEAPTKGAGSGYTIHNLLMSEVALWPFADISWSNLTEAVPEDGWVFAESQAFGAFGEFYKQYRDAAQGKTRFSAFEFRWPWEYSEQEIELIKAGLSQSEFARLYDCNFLQSGRPFFPSEYIVINPGQVSRPARKEAYHGIGVDTGSGAKDGDPSSAIVLDLETGEQVYTLRGNWRPYEFARKVAGLQRHFPGSILVEENGVGTATCEALDSLGIPIQRWNTNSKTKPIMFAELEEALRYAHVKLSNEETARQLYMIQRNENDSAEAPEGEHDDDVVALALAWQARKARRVGVHVYTPPKEEEAKVQA